MIRSGILLQSRGEQARARFLQGPELWEIGKPTPGFTMSQKYSEM